MIKPELPGNEEARLAALRDYQVMDTLPEQAYDDITRLASFICRTPISLITLLDEERQWFKSAQGLGDVRETPRDMAFCAHAILQPDQTLVVPDALRDARFAGNTLVQDLPHIRFYAGAPLVTSSGEALGTLCVIDSSPRELTDEQLQALETLSRQVMAQLEARLSERKMHEASIALQNSEARFHAFMDNGPMVAYMKDAQGRMLYTNRQLTEQFHKSREEMLGKSDAELWPPDMAQQLREHDLTVLAADSMVTVEEQVPAPDGTTQHWLAFKFPLLQPDGSKILAGMSLDITERKFYERQMAEYQLQLERMVGRLEELATTDAMTGLKNKGAFETRIREEWDRAHRYHLPLTLLSLDVDRFKQYNDSFGHPAGDEVLKQVAEIMRVQARPSDFVARTGGEEFSVILANTSADGAFIVAERLRRAIEHAAWAQRGITASIGLACARPEVEDVTSLIECADRALYHAKQTGRNRVALGASCH